MNRTIFDQSNSDSLESTNKLLTDLERKLSIISSTSSSQTQQSHTSQHSSSSVIINRNLNGTGQRNIHSSVLSYIKNNEDEFNPNELFQERQQKFMTKLGKNYNNDLPSNPGLIDNYENNKFGGSGKVGLEFDTPYPKNYHHDNLNRCSLDSSKSEDTNEIYYQDQGNDSFDDENEEDENDDDDLLMPPSPPRTPPRIIDPDKLYGLYDFSGPDPSHCTLARDEPVYLINDQDNYWWLIKKLTKEERIEHNKKRNEIKDDSDVITDGEYTDEEDGKIGFVPAECLETYGERLARLNCFKNEELEKVPTNCHKDDELNLGDLDVDPIKSNCELYPEDLPLNSKSNFPSTELKENERTSTESSLKTKCLTKKKMGKSVTFENLRDLILDEDEEENQIQNTNKIGLNYSYDEVIKDGLLNPPNFDDERSSEVLSDIYPTESPLIVNKNNRKKLKSLGNPIRNFDRRDSDLELDDFLAKPPVFKKTYDEISIGSFSPDTPKNTFQSSFSSNHSTPKSIEGVDEDHETTMLRRSVILDKLNQVTTDIEALQLNDYDTFDNQEDNLSKFQSNEGDLNNFDSDEQLNNSDENSDDETYITRGLNSDDTPLTSMNSLNNGILPIKSLANTDIAEKRKSKPVLDIFVPILGKFDELADKLAELNDLL